MARHFLSISQSNATSNNLSMESSNSNPFLFLESHLCVLMKFCSGFKRSIRAMRSVQLIFARFSQRDIPYSYAPIYALGETRVLCCKDEIKMKCSFRSGSFEVLLFISVLDRSTSFEDFLRLLRLYDSMT